MEVDELDAIMPDLLEGQFPGAHRRAGGITVPSGMQDATGWVVEPDGVFCVMRAGRGGPGFLRMRCGIAHAIPRSSELAYYVAAADREFMVGRAYLAYGEEFAMVVLEETALAPVLSLEYRPSFQDLFDRMATLFEQARQVREEVTGRFGGRPFGGEDWGLLTF